MIVEWIDHGVILCILGQDKICIREAHLRVMESMIDFTDKTSSLVSLIAFIVFNGLIGVEKFTYWTYSRNMRIRDSIDSKTAGIRPCEFKLCIFELTCISFGLTPVLPILKYAKYIIRLTQCHLEPSYNSMVLKLYR